ncbi:MAG: hypothetical protein KF812_05130, partial [Fimbriimonadaceae bacterium]|nr:hypothetical protein [Fimbriimonadaceae bacterium]
PVSIYVSLARYSHAGFDSPVGMADTMDSMPWNFEVGHREVQLTSVGELSGEKVTMTSKGGFSKKRLVGFCGYRNKVAILYYAFGPDTSEVDVYFDKVSQGMKHVPIRP